MSFYGTFVKRIIDIVLSLVALIILSPIIVIIAILVRINMGSPVIFHQKRPGKDGRIFGLMKFRSMTNKKDENGNLLPDEQRLTKFGRILRSTSLDELPELINIIKGDMSIVGPRPLLPEYLEYYNEREMRRHSVRPGLTGLAQVSGRNAIGGKEKFDKDIEYIENITLRQDVRIVALTIKKIFVREGIEFNNSESIYEYFARTDR